MGQKWKGILYLFQNVEAFPIYAWICFLTKWRTGLLTCHPLVLLCTDTPLMISYSPTKKRLLCQVESQNTFHKQTTGRKHYTKRYTWKPYSAYNKWGTGPVKCKGDKIKIFQSRAGSKWFELYAYSFNQDTLGHYAQNIWWITNTHGRCKAKSFTNPLINNIHIE